MSSCISRSGVLIGIDLGTTGCRSLVFDSRLQPLGEAYIECPLHHVSDRMYEQNAEQWWQLAVQVVRRSLDAGGVPPDSVRAVGISSQGIAFVPVDGKLDPLRPAISWLDTRASRQRDRILERFSEEMLFRCTGKRTNEAYVLPKLLWLKEHEPEVYRSADKFLMAHDFIAARLTGHAVTDHSLAGGTLLYDIAGQVWSDPLLSAFEIRRGTLPELLQAGTPVGVISRVAAEALGLPDGVVVAVGGQDQKCAALAAGLKPGRAAVSLGTAAAVSTRHEKPILDEAMRIPCFSDVLPDRWVLEGVIGTACAALEWVKRSFFQNMSYAEMDALVSSAYGGSKVGSSSGGCMFFPHLAGASSPWWNRGAQGAFSGITLSTTQVDILKSVYEGVAYQITANLKVMEELSGPLDAVRLFGGGARSQVWAQIIADSAGVPVEIPRSAECAGAGAAILAGKACGVFDSPEEASAQTGKTGAFEPDPERVRYHSERYAAYLEQQDRLMTGTG
jgi:xylulokinase